MAAEQVALVVGASRGIGRQIAIDMAKNGYSGKQSCKEKLFEQVNDKITVVVAAKSSSDATKTFPWPPDPNSSQSTISTVQREITEAGGKATAITVDVRNFGEIELMVKKAVDVSNLLLPDDSQTEQVRIRFTDISMPLSTIQVPYGGPRLKRHQ